MSLGELFSDLSQRGVQLWVEGDALRIRAPAGALTPNVRASLATHKAQIVSLLKRMEAGTQASDAPIERAPRDLPIELSAAQKRMWFLHQLDGETGAYNVPVAVRMDGPLNERALELCFTEILRRHEALRATYQLVEGKPVQVIAEEASSPLRVVDLGDLDPAAREERVRELLALEARQPFDLAKGPVVRVLLIRLGETARVVSMTMHHIALDGWSRAVFIRELAALYRATCDGLPSPLPELPLQYADFARWQNAWLATGAAAAELSYWREQLRDLPELLELPTDHPRPPTPSYRGGVWRFELDRELAEQLRRLSSASSATLFMTLLTGFVVLLSRYSGSSDITVGSPIANRLRPEIAPLIGFFANTLALRTSTDGDPTVEELLARVRKACLDAYAHQNVPFEHLVEELRPARSVDRTPIFQVMFALNVPTPKLELSGIEITPIELGGVTSKFDLALSLEEREAGLVGWFEHSADLFDAETVADMAANYRAVLEAMVRDPARPIGALPVLSAEQAARLDRWNDTRAAGRAQTVVERFDAIAARWPEAIAVEDGPARVSYGELSRRAARLARRLVAEGLGPDEIVGIQLERSVELMVALLGVLKAGGAFMGLDPSLPRRRIEAMTEAVEVRFVVTDDRARDGAVQGTRSTLRIEDAAAPGPEDGRPLELRCSPDSLAYVVFTSGSTGKPKGVAMPHRCLDNLLSWQVERFAWRARTLQYTACHFDVFFQEVLSTWASGGTLVLVSEPVRRDPVALLGHIKQARVERWFVPFAALQQLAEVHRAGLSDVPESLREVITAGEQLQVTPAIEGFFAGGLVSLENQYGPSETHVVTAFRLTGPSHTWPRLPPIGRPIRNTQVHVLDRNQQRVPAGVTGELYLGGEGLARGYLGATPEDRSRFMPDPISGRPGARLYRTGDFARLGRDGELEYLGRRDQQVKIRGHRVELGEIEAALSRHPLVREVAVRCEQEGDRKLLAAYVVLASEPGDGGAEAAAALREHLRELLPAYMIPDRFAALPALPRSRTGKIDRMALATGAHRSLGPGVAPRPDRGRAPRGPLEQALADIFCGLLDISDVRDDASFFELGGHSLLATQLLFRVRERLAVDLPLQQVFATPTVAGLAAWLSKQSARRAAPLPPCILPLHGRGDGRPLFLLPPNVGSPSCYADLDWPAQQRVYGLQLPGLVDGAEPLGSIEQMASYCAAALRAVQPEGPYLLGGWSLGAVLALATAIELESQGQEVRLAALIDGGYVPGAADRSWWQLPTAGPRSFFRAAKVMREAGIPTSYEELRRWTRWCGLLLPDSPHELRERELALHLQYLGSAGRQATRAFEMARRNVFAAARYSPAPYGGKITLFRSEHHRGKEDPLVERLRRVARGGVEVIYTPGNHMTMMLDAEMRRHLSSKLNEQLLSSEGGKAVVQR
uniref:Non-ribosomal peptide synthase n=1 Tax=Sorangium cellulosum TaxID=56 RepID=F1B9Q7_SORCE|nr:non-ribosomal peptide synthase [Sorangium cellulosum]